MQIQLLNKETIVSESPVHWKNLLIPGALLALGLFVAGYKLFDPEPSVFTLLPTENLSPETIRDISTAEAGIGVIVAVIALVYVAITASKRYYVTNQRIIVAAGLVNKTVTEMFIDKCETVRLEQPLLDHFFGSGEITCSGAGTQLVLEDVVNAREFKRSIIEQLSLTELA